MKSACPNSQQVLASDGYNNGTRQAMSGVLTLASPQSDANV